MSLLVENKGTGQTTDVQADLSIQCLHMPEDMFLHGEALYLDLLSQITRKEDPFSVNCRYVGNGSILVQFRVMTLKMPRKPASENVVCLCRLLNILANFSNLFLHTGKQCGP